MIESYICQTHMHIGCGESADSCGCHCHRPVYTEEILMTDFPDRNLYFLQRRVASGTPTYLDGETPKYLDPEDVAQLPVGTLLEDHAPGSAKRWLWLRIEVNAAGEGLLCIYAAEDDESTPDGVGTAMPPNLHTSLRIIGALPNTPAALVGASQG